MNPNNVFRPRQPSANPAAPAQSNQILASLLPADRERLTGDLLRVRLVPGQLLLEAGSDVHDIFFVESGLVSIVFGELAPFPASALAMIGHESAVGLLESFTGAGPALATAVAMVAGTALRMNHAAFLRGVDDMPGLRKAGGRAVRDLLQQMMQTSACNARDTLMQRCIRWLLLASERLGKADLPVTHDALAAMLGVRRSGVTVAITDLQRRNLIQTGRGRIRVLDEPGLRAVAESFRTPRSNPSLADANPSAPSGRPLNDRPNAVDSA